MAAVADLADEGQEMGLEILANAHIEGYPAPSDAWVAKWFELCAKYRIRPVEYRPLGGVEAVQRAGALAIHGRVVPDAGAGHPARQPPGVHLHADETGRDRRRTDSRAELARVHQAGATAGRAAQRAHDAGDPPADATQVEDGGRLRGLHRQGEGHAVRSGSTSTSACSSGNVPIRLRVCRVPRGSPRMVPSAVEDMVPLLPYVHCCHAKFMEMDAACNETTIPYPEIVAMLVEHKWNGYLLSEYRRRRSRPRRRVHRSPQASRHAEAAAALARTIHKRRAPAGHAPKRVRRGRSVADAACIYDVCFGTRTSTT